MNNTDKCDPKANCTNRREFLVKAGLIAGGLVLTLSAPSFALATPFADVVVPIDDKSPLNTVGGSSIVDSTVGKIIIVRTSDTMFVAFSARCTHKGFTLDYDAAHKQFSCSKHGSAFDGATGSVTHGPAADNLQSYAAKGTAKSVTVTVGS